MKTFIVFLALLLVLSAAFVYHSDSRHYMDLQNDLKTLAEECADGGAMCLDKASLDQGVLCIDPAAAQAFCEFLCGKASPEGKVTAASDVAPDGRSLSVTLVWTGDPVFHLPFLNPCSTITRSACYSWE